MVETLPDRHRRFTLRATFRAPPQWADAPEPCWRHDSRGARPSNAGAMCCAGALLRAFGRRTMISAEHVAPLQTRSQYKLDLPRCAMSQDALISWKEECDAIHREMDRLLTASWPETAEERQVRKIQFMALIERRNFAARNCLKSDGDTARSSINQQKPSETPGVLPNADPMFEVETMNVKISQEPSEETALVIDQSPQAPPADPKFEVRNFLKSLGLK
jgi:hypothetical protein